MTIKEVSINDIIPYENNPRKNEEAVDAVAASIRSFGFKVPVILDRDGVIVAGHTRVRAAKSLGMKAVPCLYADDLTPEQIKAFRLADNKVAELSEWDVELLEKELADIDFDMSEFGFDFGEEAEEIEAEEDDFEEEVDPFTKPGQLWQLGRHRLLVGDSTDPDSVQRLTGGAVIDLLLTDPPYNVAVGTSDRPRSNKNNVTILNDNMSEADFIAWLTKALRNADKAMKAGAAYYIFYAGLHHIEFQRSIENIKDWKLHEQLVWVKNHFVLGRNSDYQWMHEPCLYGWKEGAEHYFTNSRAETTVIEDTKQKLSTMRKGELVALCEKLMGLREAQTVMRADKPNVAELHPTAKPQELLCYLLRNSSRKGENVLDLFGGSGSTLIACEQLGRTCYMMELDPKYSDVIIERYIKFNGTSEEVFLLDGENKLSYKQYKQDI